MKNFRVLQKILRQRTVRPVARGKSLPDTKNVTGTNVIEIAWRLDPRTGRLIVMSAEDNLVKGASGQAVQSLNILCGLAGNGGIGLTMPATVVQPAKWNAADYAANSVVQQLWARELIARLKLRGDEHVLDVGCGDGKVTAEIAQALPRWPVTGVDASAEMIAFAQKAFPAKKNPNLKFHVMDARKINLTAGFI
jgi:hypothetical protein